MVRVPFSLTLDDVGDGSGVKNANVDGSSTPVDYKLTCPEGCELEVESMSVFIADTAYAMTKYGDLATLTNGMAMEWSRGGRTIDLLDGDPIKSVAGWVQFAPDFRAVSIAGTTTEGLVGTVRFKDLAGEALRLAPGDEFRMQVQDSLTGLIFHKFKVFGAAELGRNSTFASRLLGP